MPHRPLASGIALPTEFPIKPLSKAGLFFFSVSRISFFLLRRGMPQQLFEISAFYPPFRRRFAPKEPRAELPVLLCDPGCFVTPAAQRAV